jgi:hypothetical protein
MQEERREMDVIIKHRRPYLDVWAQVVCPSLAALLADPAGEELGYRCPLPVAVLPHLLFENAALTFVQETDAN